jgi:hypothetical protein
MQHSYNNLNIRTAENCPSRMKGSGTATDESPMHEVAEEEEYWRGNLWQCLKNTYLNIYQSSIKNYLHFLQDKFQNCPPTYG